MRTLLQHSCTIDGAPHCFVLRRHSDPHPDVVFLIEMLPHLISANPVAVQLLLACFRCCCLICTSCLLCLCFFLIFSITLTNPSRTWTHSHLGGDRTPWLASSIAGKCEFCWESNGSRKESGRSLPSLVGTVHRLQMPIVSGKLVVTKKTVH